MKNIIDVFLCIGMLLLVLSVKGQDTQPVKFTYDKVRLNQNEVKVTIAAKITADVKLYSLQKQQSDILYTSLSFDSSVKNYITSAIVNKSITHSEIDGSVNANVNYYTGSASFEQIVKVQSSDSIVLKGHISYIYKKAGEYIPGEEAFKIFIQKQLFQKVASTNDKAIGNQPLWWIFLAAFGGGLLALLTPCVYSMIPVTVNFFTNRSKNKKEGIRNAAYYAVSIIVIFTVAGFLITIIFGPLALNNMATHWIANLIFFTLFAVFEISFLGAFEITLPSSWTNNFDSKAGSTSFLGIFFMALTLVLVSFSCTGPIIGNLLVLAAKGSYWRPLTGMFGFSLALAMPFALFAFFPSKLNILGKAGGWLNALKVTLGFLELALALKFLSNADLAKGWRLLDREVFINLLIVIFLLLGMYLLGKIKLQYDNELSKNDFGQPYISVKRLLLAFVIFAFALCMIPGLWGAPLKRISAFMPPMGTQDFALYQAIKDQPVSAATSAEMHTQKYYEEMKIYEPEVVTKYGMITYFDYDEALAAARKLHKPLMLDFTGINCVNCRKMEGQVWSDPEVMKILKEDFVIVSLYVDV